MKQILTFAALVLATSCFGQEACPELWTACGEGTIWDEVSQTCIVANVSDTDFDGCVGINDFLIHLSNFGSGCGPELPWSCGDQLEYQGYDYKTVQIGEQCWFAENLRTSSFSDGTPVSELQSSEDWMNANDGFPAWCYYENNPAHSHSLYGKLYNWNVVWSSLLGPAFNICPSGWSVPTSQQWADLATSAGDLYHEGTALKAAPDDTPSWNGTNTSGFNGLPGGRRDETGSWSFGGTMGMWWSSSPSSEAPEKAWYFQLSGSSTGYNGGFSDKTSGMSIRCIQDSE